MACEVIRAVGEGHINLHRPVYKLTDLPNFLFGRSAHYLRRDRRCVKGFFLYYLGMRAGERGNASFSNLRYSVSMRSMASMDICK